MTRTSIFIIGLAAALTFPTAASAACGTMQGSYAVTCEQGVTVYRHNALSGIPAPLSQAEAIVEAEEIRAKTARSQLAAQERANLRATEAERRQLALDEYNSRVYNTNVRRQGFPIGVVGGGFGFGSNVGFGAGVNGRRSGQGVRSRSRFVNRGY